MKINVDIDTDQSMEFSRGD